MVDDRSAWKAIGDLYFEDKVEEALALIHRTGSGEGGANLSWFRMIEAEAVSRRGSEVRQLASFLEVEFIPEETPGGIEAHIPLLLNACARVSRSLWYAHGPPTRLAFLSEAANAPWATSPHGYCIDMYPYEKLCMPSSLFHQPKQLAETVAHEYAHVATLNTTQGRAARWFEEAVSMQFERDPDRRDQTKFERDEAPWLAPGPLNVAFGSDDQFEVWDAYQQSMWIGRYIRARAGDDTFVALIREMGADRRLQGMWARFLGRSADDEGLRSTLGESSGAVFQGALDWLKKGRPGDPGPFPE
jgi:hypothetical protein